jgi:hypothetical protein
MKAIDRLFEYLQVKGMKVGTFETELGLKNARIKNSFDRKGYLKEDFIVKLMEYDPDLNLDWLVMGHGKMFKSEEEDHELYKSINHVAEPLEKYDVHDLTIVKDLIKIIGEQQGTIRKLSDVLAEKKKSEE